MSTSARKEVMAEIIRVMEEAEAQGASGWMAAERAFPGIPTEVLATADIELNDRKTEAWWQSVERTIDGEVIRNAVAKAGAQ